MLTIKDLSQSKELNRETLRAVSGGIMPGGCVIDPWGLPPQLSIPEVPTMPELPGYPSPIGNPRPVCPADPFYPI